MSNLPTNPLQGLLQRAAQTLPATTGAVAAQQERLDRRKGQVVILADISASMDSLATGAQRKIDVLREAVGQVRQQIPSRLFVFSASAREVSEVPESEESTNLAGALRDVQQLDPGVTLVICDGRPDNEAQALQVARSFRGAIDVLYIGPENDLHAINFMNRLAQAAGGTMREHDVTRIGHSTQQLSRRIAGLLQ